MREGAGFAAQTGESLLVVDEGRPRARDSLRDLADQWAPSPFFVRCCLELTTSSGRPETGGQTGVGDGRTMICS